jgi:hypothetical protein
MQSARKLQISAVSADAPSAIARMIWPESGPTGLPVANAVDSEMAMQNIANASWYESGTTTSYKSRGKSQISPLI